MSDCECSGIEWVNLYVTAVKAVKGTCNATIAQTWRQQGLIIRCLLVITSRNPHLESGAITHPSVVNCGAQNNIPRPEMHQQRLFIKVDKI